MISARVCLAHLTLLMPLAFAAPAQADAVPDATPESIEVTATRTPEPIASVPASVTVISGQEMRDRNVTDLAGVAALVSGVEAPPGGDAGPASAVPSLLGLHEFDAFLLVVDGVPWGGAFNPSIPTLDLTDVDRVEILKGSAPVTYGATSFVGVIQVIHFAAGQSEDRVLLGYATHGQAQGSLSTALPSLGGWRQSITLQGASQGFADRREQVSDGKLLYRGAGDVAGGTLQFDVDLAFERTTPPSPVIRSGLALTTLTPIDANANPSDARIDDNRYHGVLHYTRDIGIGTWETTLSTAFDEISDIRGFLRPDLTNDGAQNADSQNQRRRIEDGYVDSHIASTLLAHVTLLYGADMLYGLGKQDSINGAYYAPLSGIERLPATTALHVDEVNSLSDRRIFLGQYVQADYMPLPRLDVIAGLRINETFERQISTHIDGFDAGLDLAGRSDRQVVRPSFVAGASYALWEQGRDRLSPYLDYRNTFKPSAIDFGPDFTPEVLRPETADDIEIGIKGDLLGSKISFDVDAFYVDFKNLVVATTDADGNPILQNAGGQRLRGVEGELRTSVAPDLTLSLNGSYHDATFTHYIATEGGQNVNAAGKQLPLAPHYLASAGLLYAPPSGFFGSAIVSYVGRRYLDLANDAPVGGYTTVAASAGYRFRRCELQVTGTNLSNARPPVTQSEFGDSSYYLLPGRSLLVTLAARL
jgi:outer membrane receptor protein involved in Fe transport